MQLGFAEQVLLLPHILRFVLSSEIRSGHCFNERVNTRFLCLYVLILAITNKD